MTSPGMKFQYSEFQKGRSTRWGRNSRKTVHPGGRINEYRPHGIELWTLIKRKEEGREKGKEEEY